MKRTSVVVSMILLAQAIAATPLQAADVTALVIRDTDLDERIAEACQKHCQGNRRKGWLRRVTVDRVSAHTFIVRADATLRSRHHQDPPKVLGTEIGGGFQVYSYTIRVEAYGTLDDRSCDLKIDRVKVVNDRLGLGSLARRQEGKVHRIENCDRFLSGV